MSDAKLRDLERRWKETGSPDDEAAYLLERVRVGDLSRERLELAAYCGHEGASRAIRGSRRTLTAGPALIDGIAHRFGHAAGVRAIAALAAAVLHMWESTHPSDARPRLAIAAATRWTDCPCLDCARFAFQAAREAHHAFAEEEEASSRTTAAWNSAHMASRAAHAANLRPENWNTEYLWSLATSAAPSRALASEVAARVAEWALGTEA